MMLLMILLPALAGILLPLVKSKQNKQHKYYCFIVNKQSVAC